MPVLRWYAVTGVLFCLVAFFGIAYFISSANSDAAKLQHLRSCGGSVFGIPKQMFTARLGVLMDANRLQSVSRGSGCCFRKAVP